MRPYLYLECSDPRALDALPGCRYVADAHRGHGPELWFGNAKMPEDYPAKVALVTSLPGGLLQVAPVDASAGGALQALLSKEAGKAGIVVHASAKDLDDAKPELAAAVCYEQVADKDGKPTGKKPGAELRVAMALAGDDPAIAADPDRGRISPTQVAKA